MELLNLDARARGNFFTSPLVVAIGVSVSRLLMGFTIALGFGAPMGLLLWRSKLMDRAFGPFFLGIQTLPSVCWIPLAVLTFGINQKAILFVTVMGSAFAIALSLRDGLRIVPPIYHRAGLMLGAHGWRFYIHILLPASLPAFVSSLRQGFSFAWRSLMGGELVMIINPHGLGVLLDHGRNFSDVAQVIAVMIIMIVLGMVVDRAILARFEQRIHQRFGLIESH
jgi:NitT/TauT family transport system permease protein